MKLKSRCWSPLLVKYDQLAKRLLENFDYDLRRISREENGQMDALTKLVSAKVVVNNKTIIQETCKSPTLTK